MMTSWGNDIRGRVGTEITAEYAETLGRAFGHYLKRETKKPVERTSAIVGWDCRLSSSILAAAAVRGLRDAGVDVIRIGTAPTALFNFGIFSLPVRGGIMVTGGELSCEYNGFIFSKKDRLLTSQDLDELRALCGSPLGDSARGSYADRNILPIYIAFHHEWLRTIPPRSKRMIVDTANGTVGTMARALLHARGDTEFLHLGLNGRFLNRHPHVRDARSELSALAAAICGRQADFGLAIDGDANQMVVLDEKGEWVPHATIAALFARAMGSQHFSDAGQGRYLFKERELLYDDAVYSALLFRSLVSELEQPISSLSGRARSTSVSSSVALR